MSDALTDAIAIIGISCRVPGAASADALWQNVRRGVESITQYSDEALAAAGVDRALLADPRYVKAGADLAAIDLFDASFFDINAAEAELIDPQHRLFLECAWEALERAGYAADAGERRVGVYGGCGINFYLLHAITSARDRLLASLVRAGLANDKDYLTSRVSYKLGLTGPSVGVQTACSTSLVAVHLACRALLDGEADLALAGGVSLRVPAGRGYLHEEGGVLSPDGHCRAFDAAGAGTVFGSGVGIVALKRLDEAIDDDDSIVAVIRGSAINNDGHDKVGFSAPSVSAQADVIASAIAAAGVDARSIGYVEAHGTGTTLGDPIEMAALTRAFKGWTADTGFCALGSIKTNIGHLDAAAGVAGLIKAALALEHGEIPPSLHFRQANPQINFADSPFAVSTALTPWPATASPRRAGVSSFGMGGTNCHVVLEEAPAPQPRARRNGWYVVPVSAKSAGALDAAVAATAAHIASAGDSNDLADIAFTCQAGRKPFAHRRVLSGATGAELAASAEAPSRRRTAPASAGRTTGVAFMFPGQGSQFAGMGRELYLSDEVVRQTVDEAAARLQGRWPRDLRELLFATPESGLRDTRWLQPALFVLEVALARMWRSWGVEPCALLGHSVGEYAGAVEAGVLSFGDALDLLVERGTLLDELPRGSMLTVAMRESAVADLIGDALDIAAINGAERTVVSGDTTAIEALEQRLTVAGVACRRLETSHGFHSRMIEPVCRRFRDVVARTTLRPPTLPIVSGLTGRWMSAAEATDPDYWVAQLRRAVRFHDGVQTLAGMRPAALLEVGPGGALTALAKAATSHDADVVVAATLTQNGAGHPVSRAMRVLAEIWSGGADVDWRRFARTRGGRRVPAPTYPFQRSRYWLDGVGDASASPQPQPAPASDGPALYVPAWIHTPLDPDRAALEGQHCLVLGSGPVADALVETLDRGGAHATRAMGVADADGYRRLLAARAHDDRLPTRIVHLLNLRDADSHGDEYGSPIDRSFHSLVALARALADYGDREIAITIVSVDAHVVLGHEPVQPHQALTAGPHAVIPSEYPNVRAAWIDLSHDDLHAMPPDAVAARIAGEMTATAREPIAYRGQRRLARTFTEIRLAEAARSGAPLPGGAHVILGGFGGIGAELARALTRTPGAKIALVGRTPLPDRNTWDQAREPSNDATSRRISLVLDLERAGADVLVAAADIADETQLAAAIAAAEARFGRITGVIHAAGRRGSGVMQFDVEPLGAELFAAKVAGTQALARVLERHRVDVVLLCSSLQSLAGSPGQCDYAAANAFQDAFAHAQRGARGTRWLAVNWDTWRRIGMAARIDAGLAVDDATALVGPLLAGSWPQVAMLAQRANGELTDHLRAAAIDLVRRHEPPVRAPQPRPEALPPYVAPRSPVEVVLARAWQRVLGVEAIGIDDGFFDLGGDSVAALQAAADLSAALGRKVAPAAIIAAGTIRTLAPRLGPTPAPARADEARARGERRRAIPPAPRRRGAALAARMAS